MKIGPYVILHERELADLKDSRDAWMRLTHTAQGQCEGLLKIVGESLALIAEHQRLHAKKLIESIYQPWSEN